MDLLDAVSRVPWDAPRLGVDDYPGFWARFDRLRQRRQSSMGALTPCGPRAPWCRQRHRTPRQPRWLAAAIEGLFQAQRGADPFAPLLFGLDARQRRQLYTAGWLVRCWERGVAPEPLLTLLVLAFDGGPPAMTEGMHCARAHPASFTVGAVRLLEAAPDHAALDEA